MYQKKHCNFSNENSSVYVILNLVIILQFNQRLIDLIV